MELSVAIVLIVAMVLFACVIVLALCLKGKVKASGQFRGGSFSLEAEERRR
jgi:hypothetical protein